MGQTLTHLQKNILNEKNMEYGNSYPGDGRTPPIPRHVLTIDPRSPSQSIPRTPIEVEGASVSMNLKKKLVRKANKILNPFKADAAALPTVINGESYSYMFFWGSRLTREYLEWMLGLSNDNMGSFYDLSHYVYDLVDRKHEFRNPFSRYVITKNAEAQLVAYCRYQFEVDNGLAALQCSEIEVEKEFQGKGIGSTLLSVVFAIAKRASMDKVTVKIFSSNNDALKFFHKNGFITEAACNGEKEIENFALLAKYCL